MSKVKRILNLFLYIFSSINGIYSEYDDGLRFVMRRQGGHGRRYDMTLDMNGAKEIIGAPSLPSHLPEAEPILPGHTLLRPALGMLKSSIKFPHRELENGAGVLGNIDNLSIKYDGKNERVLYSGFRRNAPDIYFRRSPSPPHNPLYKDTRKSLADYIMVVPSVKSHNPSFSLSNLVLDLDDEEEASARVLDRLKLIKPINFKKPKSLVMYVADLKRSPLYLTDLFNKKNTVLTNYKPESFLSPMFSKEAMNYELNSLLNGRRDGDTHADDSIEGDVTDDEHSHEDNSDTEKKEELKKKTKQQHFYDTAKLYNTVKISADAFNFEDLIPDVKSRENQKKKQNERPWWFFNQVDFSPFEQSTINEK